MKYTKNIGKKGLVLLALLICGAVITSAVMITYYAKNTSTHNVGHLYVIDEDSTGVWTTNNVAEEFDIAWNPTNLVPGDSELFHFNITLSGQSNANKNLYFHMVNDTANGVDLTIWNVDTNSEVENGGFVTFTPGSTVHFEYRLSIDAYAPEGNYGTSLSLEKN